MDISIRQATPDDADAIVRVINAAYAVESFFINTDRTYAEEVVGMMKSGRFLVARSEPGRNIAGAVYLREEGDEGYFGMLAVEPALQRHGIGRRLVEEAERQFAAAGCSSVRLVAPNLRTELFPSYAAQGYVERGRLPFPEPEKLKQPAHMVEMVKRL